MSTKIWLSSPHMGGNELKYIHQAFDDNWVAPLGPNVNNFEHDLEGFLQEDVTVTCLSSGTAALHLALLLLNVQAGDEVFCQTLTFSASANPIAYVCAKPVFIDSETDTWNMCPQVLRAGLQMKKEQGKLPKTVIVVHLYGMPAKMDEIAAICEEYQVPLLEDAAEALGSSFKGQKCGTFGKMSILSFNGNKIITTSGGGALIVKDKEDKKRAIFLATQARDDEPHFQHSHIGYNYRMSNICAGIGRGQMEVLDDRVEARRKNNQFYKEIFQNVAGVELLTEPNEAYFSNHWLSAITIDPEKAGFTCEHLRLELLKEQIESRPLWKPMHLQPIFQDAEYLGNGVAEKLFVNGLCLPSGSNLTDEDLARISTVIKNILANHTYESDQHLSERQATQSPIL